MRTSPGVRAAQYVALFGYVVFLGFPLLWLVSTAFKPPAELSQLTPTLFPVDWTWSNFQVAFAESQLPGALRNSFVVAVATAIMVLQSCMLQGTGNVLEAQIPSTIVRPLILIALLVLQFWYLRR